MEMVNKQSVEVLFSPTLYEHKLTKKDFIVVIVDILRATTSVCAALDFGIQAVIPVAGVDGARDFKSKGFLVACERDGRVLDFADMGNSPSDFKIDTYRNRVIAFSTTNGTKAVNMASDSEAIVLGSFVNLSAVAGWLNSQKKNVVILCAAWKKLFNLEDSVFAGALSEKLLAHENFYTECDSVRASLGLWKLAKDNLYGYLSLSSHRNRLKHLVTEEDFRYTVTPDTTAVVPVLQNGRFVDIYRESSF